MQLTKVAEQIAALEPGIPGYQVSAFALELLEKIKSDGVTTVEKHTDFTGYSFPVPSEMMVVQEVWINGVRASMDMNKSDIVITESASSQTLMTDEDGSVMTDEGGELMIDEDSNE